MKDQPEFLERRRNLLRGAVKDSRAIEAILLSQGKLLEYERQRQATLDAEAELMDAESENQMHNRSRTWWKGCFTNFA